MTSPSPPGWPEQRLLHFHAAHFHTPLNPHAAFVHALLRQSCSSNCPHTFFPASVSPCQPDRSRLSEPPAPVETTTTTPAAEHGAGEHRVHSDDQPDESVQIALTDELIEIFRHSESWKKERAQILKRERLLAAAEEAIAAAKSTTASGSTSTQSGASPGSLFPQTQADVDAYRASYGDDRWERVARLEAVLNADFENVCKQRDDADGTGNRKKTGTKKQKNRKAKKALVEWPVIPIRA